LSTTSTSNCDKGGYGDVDPRLDHPRLIAGFIASKIVNRQGEGFFLDIILGVIGGVVGGWLFERFGATGVTGFNLYSMFVADIGAVIVLVVYHAIRRVV
jgi:uncharacterized membrane protein YeaQ/YmgE (transglycosylase-associated protein family)